MKAKSPLSGGRQRCLSKPFFGATAQVNENEKREELTHCSLKLSLRYRRTFSRRSPVFMTPKTLLGKGRSEPDRCSVSLKLAWFRKMETREKRIRPTPRSDSLRGHAQGGRSALGVRSAPLKCMRNGFNRSPTTPVNGYFPWRQPSGFSGALRNQRAVLLRTGDFRQTRWRSGVTDRDWNKFFFDFHLEQ